MTSAEALELLRRFRSGQISESQVLGAFQTAPVADLGFARVDLHRSLRKGFPEVILGQGKTPRQVLEIARALLRRERRLLITRATPEHFKALQRKIPARHHPDARCITVGLPRPGTGVGRIAVVCAGTSDLPVAEEAAITAEIMGNRVVRQYDVGIAGLHRVVGCLEELRSANVLVIVAGMEGALPSVVAGLLDRPIIAVPTSIGYGAHFQGLAPLLAMLNSCGSGVTVVNIDNGFGAGYAASQINHLVHGSR